LVITEAGKVVEREREEREREREREKGS